MLIETQVNRFHEDSFLIIMETITSVLDSCV